MPPHLSPGNDARPLSTREMFGLSLLMPEPEVARATVSKAQGKALASIIVALIEEHEPMLKAKADGATVTVRTGGTVMQFTIEAER